MPIGTGTITLLEVMAEIGGLGTSSSLGLCIGAAILKDYHPTYFQSPATSLLEFRGYDKARTVYAESLGYSASSSAAACSAGTATYYTIGSATWTSSTGIFTTSAGTTYAASGWYEQGGFWKRWDATTGSFIGAGSC